MFGFLRLFTSFYIFSNKSIAVGKCGMSFRRSISSEVLAVGFWQQQDEHRGDEAKKRQRQLKFRSIAGSTTWLGREFVVEAVVAAEHCGTGRLSHVKTRFISFM